MTWFHLQFPVLTLLGKHWTAGKPVAMESGWVLLPSTAVLLQTTFHQKKFDSDKNAVTSGCFGVDWDVLESLNVKGTAGSNIS